MKSRTIVAGLEEYNARCYPDGLTRNQSDQIRQAFLAGALFMTREFTESADMSDEDGKFRAAELMEELLIATKDHVAEMKTRKKEGEDEE